MGSIYQRRLRSGKLGPTLWIKYHIAGRPVRESTHTDKITKARRILQ